MKKVIGFIAFVLILMVAVSCSAFKKEINIDFSDRYEKISYATTGFRINEDVNARSEPIVISNNADGGTNSFGMARKSGSIRVTRVFETSEQLDANGPFYGFYASEILSTDEGRASFPEGIESDEDGIIWVNAQYVWVSYPDVAPQF